MLLIVLLTVPALRHAFSFGPMTPLDWLVALVAGLIGVAWFEIYKTGRISERTHGVPVQVRTPGTSPVTASAVRVRGVMRANGRRTLVPRMDALHSTR